MKYLDLILSAADKIRESSNKEPYAIFCNENVYEALKKQASEISNKKSIHTGLQIISIHGLIIEINNYIDDTQILVVNKETYEAIMSKDIDGILKRLRSF